MYRLHGWTGPFFLQSRRDSLRQKIATTILHTALVLKFENGPHEVIFVIVCFLAKNVCVMRVGHIGFVSNAPGALNF